MKKIICAVLICIILTGGIMIGLKGFKVDTIYSKSVKIEIYFGKEFDNQEVKQIAKEVFGTNYILVQKVELFEDMVAITVAEKDVQNLDEQLEDLCTRINEKYELENTVADITATHQPKVRLSSLLKPYIAPSIVSVVLILVYGSIHYRKLGMWKIIAEYILAIILTEATYASIIAITRTPINQLTLPIGLFVYVITVTVLTIVQEKKLETWKLEQVSKK